MEINRLALRQKQKAIDVLVAAFFDYPMFDLYFPRPGKDENVFCPGTWRKC